MRKILTTILLFVILCSTMSFFFVNAESDIPFVNDGVEYAQAVTVDFEEDTSLTYITVTGAESSITASGRGAGKGQLSVTPASAENSIFVPFGGKNGNSYHASFISTSKQVQGIVHFTTNDPTTKSQRLSFETKELSEGWFKYTADFTNPENLTGPCSLEIISTDKTTYAIDEIILAPKLNSSVAQEGNLVKYSSFETAEEISKLSYNKRIITLSQATAPNDLDQKCLHVICNGKGWGNVSQNVNLRVGRKYQISFWAKAADDATNGLEINLAIDRNRRTDPLAPLYEQPYDEKHPTITNKWVHYSFIYQCITATTDTCTPSIYLRVGNKSTDVLNYYLDDLVITEIPDSYDVDVSATLSGDVFERSAMNLNVQGYMNSVGVWYRLYAPFQNEYVIVKSGYLANGENAKYYAENNLDGNYKVEYNAVDAWGIAGSTKTIFLSKNNISTTEIIRANYDTSIWIDDMETLDATVQYQAGNISKDVQAILALYDENNRLLSLDLDAVSVLPEKQKKIVLSAKNYDDAKSSKLLLWDNSSTKPLREEKRFTKTNADNYVFVDPVNGINSSTAAGTFTEPFKTMNQGRTAVRRIASKAKASGEETEIKLVLMPAVYDVSGGALTFTKSNTTVADNIHTSVVSYKPGEAIFSGGKALSGFTLYDSEKNIYRTKATGLNSRQLYVNGIRAIRARSKEGLKDCVNLGKNGTGVTTTDISLMKFKKINELELVFFEHWTNPRFVVESASFDEGAGLVTLHLNQSLWSGRMNGQNTVPTVPEYYENAYELLDEPGEFYLDKTAEYLYYIPRAHENMNTAEVVMPVAETLMTVNGTADEPMKNISFEGIHFKYCTWNAPSTSGYADGQNNGGRTATTSGFIPSALTLTNIQNVDFYNCKISKIGQTGVKMLEAVQNCDFIGNEIFDTSGGALMIGDATWLHSRAPKEEKYYVTNVNVTDNYIHDISLEYRAGAAVTAAFPKNTNISHNEIFRTSYSAIHTGWGWDSKAESGTVNFKINNNYLHKILFDKMYDGGAIYVLGHTGGSLENLNEMCGNYCYDIANKFGVLYPDQGSSYWYLDRNVVDLTPHPVWYGRGDSPLNARWTHIHMNTIEHIVYGSHNYSTTSEHINRGSNIQYQKPNLFADANWPQEALDIIDNSGVRKEYRDNFDFGLQEVYFPKEFLVNIGEKVRLAWVPTTTKMTKYDIGNAAVIMESLNPEIAVIDSNGDVTGISAGTATIRMKICEKEMERIYEGTVVVP